MAVIQGKAVDESRTVEASAFAAPLLIMAVVYLVYAWDRVVVPVELV